MTLVKTTYPTLKNKRLIYIVATILCMILGLASRKIAHLLPLFVAENAGDMIWAMMIYFGFRFLLIQKNLFTTVVISFLFCFCIEFSQLYQASWINQIRRTVVGGLILGKGFLTIDLIRYSVGIITAAILDRIYILYHTSNR
ncbi:ribosomal maturation YjgA family protein [Robertmurraya massiliosenegalensis]|uniref:ribosomal maturation YjgA family protein n=1 Tax=Robertmurraya massiliosenegalensis TaxID=1287657 RepID=UPI00037A90C9|nr:DUF2809 domain-containing protein [Robertmurraya massiliosenegalensis]